MRTTADKKKSTKSSQTSSANPLNLNASVDGDRQRVRTSVQKIVIACVCWIFFLFRFYFHVMWIIGKLCKYVMRFPICCVFYTMKYTPSISLSPLSLVLLNHWINDNFQFIHIFIVEKRMCNQVQTKQTRIFK